MSKLKNWTLNDKKALLEIAFENSQVRFIISDIDVRNFYTNILENMKGLSEKELIIKKEIEVSK